jgi:hypothetical protein
MNMEEENLLTEKELEIINQASDLWNNFYELPVIREEDRITVCRAINTVQQLVMVRPIRRAYPELF